MQDFKNIVHSCFGHELRKNYTSHIAAFQKSFTDLGVSITPKVHAVFFHIQDFCEKSGKGLGSFSEQSVESSHSDFTSFWQNFKVDPSHPEFAEKLLQTVCQYNNLHL